MSEVERLLEDLDHAREDLLASFEDVEQDVFARRPAVPGPRKERWAIRDVLWHVGLLEDWSRRTTDRALEGRAPEGYAHRDRPAIANTPEYLAEWLEQSRRPTLALLRRLSDDALDREVVLPEGATRTVRGLLEHLVEHDRKHAAEVRELRELPPPPER